MSVPFTGSRLANLREKRQSQIEKLSPTKQVQQPLTLPDQQDNSYQPSMAFNAGRTATRFLKGRIQKPSNGQRTSYTNVGSDISLPNKQNNVQPKFGLKLNEPDNSQMKLVLNDSPLLDKKKSQIKASTQQPPQKRILIQKKQQKQQPKQAQVKQQPKPTKNVVNKVQEQVIQPKNDNIESPIKQQDVQQSKDVLENENELVECPEGCGRKFNRKALQKHAKACKLVFMSKRKQFNSEAKRLTSQEQAALVKQNKLQQKKAQLGKTKGKGFDKTSDNWKAASQDFRSAIKAIKKDENTEVEGKEEMKVINCDYCQKPFAEVLLPKHLENCIVKKQKQQKQKKKAPRKK